MKNLWKLIIVVILACAVIAVVTLKNKERQSKPDSTIAEKVQSVSTEPNESVVSESNQPVVPKNLPTIIDLGADKCVPCKMMFPVLEQLTAEYKGKLNVIFYDVWKSPAFAEKYNVDLIPTQVFLDPNDKELFRHQGFFSKEEILAKWKELGYDVNSPQAVH